MVRTCATIAALALCGPLANSAQAQDAQVTVRTFVEATDIPGFEGCPVTVDGVEVATTDAAGQAVITVASGSHTIRAEAPGVAAGSRDVDLAPGEVVMIDIVMNGGGRLQLEATFTAAEVQGGFLPDEFTSLTLQLVAPDSSPIVLTELTDVLYEGEAGAGSTSILAAFGLAPDGSISTIDFATVESTIRNGTPGFSLVVAGEDAEESVYGGRIDAVLPEPGVVQSLLTGAGALALLSRLRARRRPRWGSL